jgi:hypothetical protein
MNRLISFFPLLLLLLLFSCGPSHPSGVYRCQPNSPNGNQGGADNFIEGILGAEGGCIYASLEFVDGSTVIIEAMGQQIPAPYTLSGDMIKIQDGNGRMQLLNWVSGDVIQGQAPLQSTFVRE